VVFLTCTLKEIFETGGAARGDRLVEENTASEGISLNQIFGLGLDL
jgi:hypothetical protein